MARGTRCPVTDGEYEHHRRDIPGHKKVEDLACRRKEAS